MTETSKEVQAVAPMAAAAAAAATKTTDYTNLLNPISEHDRRLQDLKRIKELTEGMEEYCPSLLGKIKDLYFCKEEEYPDTIYDFGLNLLNKAKTFLNSLTREQKAILNRLEDSEDLKTETIKKLTQKYSQELLELLEKKKKMESLRKNGYKLWEIAAEYGSGLAMLSLSQHFYKPSIVSEKDPTKGLQYLKQFFDSSFYYNLPSEAAKYHYKKLILDAIQGRYEDIDRNSQWHGFYLWNLKNEILKLHSPQANPKSDIPESITSPNACSVSPEKLNIDETMILWLKNIPEFSNVFHIIDNKTPQEILQYGCNLLEDKSNQMHKDSLKTLASFCFQAVIQHPKSDEIATKNNAKYQLDCLIINNQNTTPEQKTRALEDLKKIKDSVEEAKLYLAEYYLDTGHPRERGKCLEDLKDIILNTKNSQLFDDAIKDIKTFEIKTINLVQKMYIGAIYACYERFQEREEVEVYNLLKDNLEKLIESVQRAKEETKTEPENKRIKQESVTRL